MSAAMTFEKALEKLQALSSQLEEGNLSLEKSLKLYEEGVSLCSFCEKELQGAKLKMTELQINKPVEPQNEKESMESDE